MIPHIKDRYFHEKNIDLSISDHLDEIEAMLGRLDGNKSPLVEKIFLAMDDIHQRMQTDRMEEIEVRKINSQRKLTEGRSQGKGS